MRRFLPLLALAAAACEPVAPGTNECREGFVRAEDGACYADTDAPGDSGGDTADTADTAAGVRDFVVIVLDTGRLSLFDAATMPRLVSRIPDGVWVEDMQGVAAWTRPTTATMMTGVRLEEVGIGIGDDLFPTNVPTIATSFREAGFRTYLDSANVVLGHPGFGVGFEQFLLHDEVSFTEQAAAVSRFLEESADPAFVWMQAMELHVPYNQLDESCVAAVAAANEGCPIDVTVAGPSGLDFGGVDFGELNVPQRAQCAIALETAQRCAATHLDVELDPFLTELLAADTTVLLLTDHGEGWLDPQVDHNWGTTQKLTRGLFLMLNSVMEPQSVPSASQADVVPTLLHEAGLGEADPDVEGVVVGEAPEELATAWYCDGIGRMEVAAWSAGQQLIRLDDHDRAVRYTLFNTELDVSGDHDLLAGSGDAAGVDAALVQAVDDKAARTRALCIE